ncbi:hypothetical protein AYL99_11097 [Fonsecaea erecta]|uniref:Uncharacterized protein n=1 Tax=Fonsecaea erecta TaxID=1367422 RepID=A0A178Z4H9_9EURO|nr:hypothetical protein AYL99_11097 [Fonsecaea erecta]OAP54649.1 hypothetical protein AYL99_11097 [Fonsecaea erecta]
MPSPTTSSSSYKDSRTTPTTTTTTSFSARTTTTTTTSNNNKYPSSTSSPSSTSFSYSPSRQLPHHHQPSTVPKRPATWTAQHDAFVREQARNGEDAESIRILFEVEFPAVVGVSKAWVRERMGSVVVAR